MLILGSTMNGRLVKDVFGNTLGSLYYLIYIAMEATGKAISDYTFKHLPHKALGYALWRKGGEIMPSYMPDYVLKDGNRYIILESENNTNRKMFVGCLMKAAYFLQKEKTGFLVIVLHEMDNTKLNQIKDHLTSYYQWIKQAHLTNMSAVFLIRDKDYLVGNDDCVTIFSEAFLEKAGKIG